MLNVRERMHRVKLVGQAPAGPPCSVFWDPSMTPEAAWSCCLLCHVLAAALLSATCVCSM
jgi:hypothetical protein